jgi:hypothetical protein
MKKFVLGILIAAVLIPFGLTAQQGEMGFIHGDWEISGNRLYQNNTNTSIAKAWLAYPQEGMVDYNFNIRLEEGLWDDGHAGVGIHLFVDKPSRGFSWGEGHSYLLWLNYDRNPGSDVIPRGLSAQVYRSDANHKMVLLQSYDLSSVEKVVMGFPADTLLPVKITVDGRTGMVRVYDPLNAALSYPIRLGNTRPLKGSYVTLRTNSGGFSFGY